ncbi:MAG TPA: O-antigen ligase family protein [Terriglobales bacterium]|nr:O-antigen ligase family protein [Terriglobales bacterium]
MPSIAPQLSLPPAGSPELVARTESKTGRPGFGALADDALRPNCLVRWAFYLSIFSVPFSHLYLPGTGDRVGVTRLVQVLILCAVLSQPRVCLRLVPVALFWFLAYCGLRILSGLWFTPEMSTFWWPSTLELLEFALPWLWVMFNVLQFPQARRGGLWALACGCSLCALFHISGIGVVEVDKGIEGRSSVFGQNANVIGATYAMALIVLVGLGMFRGVKLPQRLLLLLLTALTGAGMAKTGSRTAALILITGVLVLLFQGGSFESRRKRFASLLLIGAVLSAIIWQIPTVMERFGKVNSSNIHQQEGRVRMAPVLWEMFLRSPIYGSGPDGYQLELTRRAMPYLIKQQRMIVSHNLVLLLLVETGVIGFLLFSSGVGAALAAAWRARFNACGSLPLALILPLAMTGVTVGDPSHDMVFWFATAYALAGAA